MNRALIIVLAGCAQYRTADLNFGENGEGLDGFLCKQGPTMLLDRGADAGTTRPASIVLDIVGLENGQPGCRTGQLIKWCAKDNHVCAPMKHRRECRPVELPAGVSALDREVVRAQVRAQLREGLSGQRLISDAPDEFVMVRVVGTAQPCDEVSPANGDVPDFDPAKLIGCAYSCPVLLDRADDVYLGFDGFVGQCEQGVRICASGTLNWMP